MIVDEGNLVGKVIDDGNFLVAASLVKGFIILPKAVVRSVTLVSPEVAEFWRIFVEGIRKVNNKFLKGLVIIIGADC
jgi:hypothetical protein